MALLKISNYFELIVSQTGEVIERLILEGIYYPMGYDLVVKIMIKNPFKEGLQSKILSLKELEVDVHRIALNNKFNVQSYKTF